MTTPFDFTQYLTTPQHLLDSSANSDFRISGEITFSGEVAFFHRITPGFAGNLQVLEAQLEHSARMITIETALDVSFSGGGVNDLKVRQTGLPTLTSFMIMINDPPIKFSYSVNGGLTWSVAILIASYVTVWYPIDAYEVRFGGSAGHSVSDTWTVTCLGNYNYEWLAKSSGESQWVSLSGKRSAPLYPYLVAAPVISVLEIENSLLPKVPLDIKMEFSTNNYPSQSGEYDIRFTKATTFFARMMGDA